MPSREKLETALRNAHKAGDTKAARRLATALKTGDYYGDTQASQITPTGDGRAIARGREGEVPTMDMVPTGEPQQPQERQSFLDVKEQYRAGEQELVDKITRPVRDFFSAPVGEPIKKAVEGGPDEGFRDVMAGVPTDVEGAQEYIEDWKKRAPDKEPPALLQDKYGNPMIQFPGQEPMYLDKPGLSFADVRQLPGQIEEVAPYLAGGQAVSGMKFLPGVASSFGLGTGINTAEQGIEMAGGERESFDPWEALKTGGLMAGGDAAGRVIVGGLSRLAAKMKPKMKVVNEDGSLTDEAVDVLRQMDAGELDDYVAKQLTKAGVMNADDAARFNLFKQNKVQPTQANVTQSVDDWKVQQEALKSEGPVRDVVESQERALFSKTDDVIQGTGAQTDDAFATGASVSDFVTQNAVKLDRKISSLYKQADKAANGRRVIDLTSLSRTLSQKGGDNQLSGGVVGAVRSMLKQRGLGMRRPSAGRVNTRPNRNINAREAEAVRKELNSIFEAANPRGKQIIRELKEALDEDVFKSVGDDFYRQARQAKADFEQQLSPEKVSKFDKTKKSVVRDILEQKLAPDDIFKRVVVSGGSRGKVRDLAQLKRYLTSTKGGQRAWSDLKGETARYLKDYATTGQSGNTAIFNGRRFKEALENKIGKQKIDLLFSETEKKQLDAIAKIGELRIPHPANPKGMGPTAQAVEDAVGNIWGVGSLMKWVQGVKKAAQEGRAASGGAAKSTQKALEKLPQTQTRGQLSPLIGTASGGASQLDQ